MIRRPDDLSGLTNTDQAIERLDGVVGVPRELQQEAAVAVMLQVEPIGRDG